MWYLIGWCSRWDKSKQRKKIFSASQPLKYEPLKSWTVINLFFLKLFTEGIPSQQHRSLTIMKKLSNVAFTSFTHFTHLSIFQEPGYKRCPHLNTSTLLDILTNQKLSRSVILNLPNAMPL